MRVWVGVDNKGGYLDFVGEFKNGQMILARNAVRPDGTAVIQRMVFQNITAREFDWTGKHRQTGARHGYGGFTIRGRAVRAEKIVSAAKCDGPLRIGHFWVQALSSVHAVAAYDISDLVHIREVSRITFDDKQKPHWIAADEDGRRIVVNSGEYGEHRLFRVNFDPQTGTVTLDGVPRCGQRTGVRQHGWQDLATRLPWRPVPARHGVRASGVGIWRRFGAALGAAARLPLASPLGTPLS